MLRAMRIMSTKAMLVATTIISLISLIVANPVNNSTRSDVSNPVNNSTRSVVSNPVSNSTRGAPLQSFPIPLPAPPELGSRCLRVNKMAQPCGSLQSLGHEVMLPNIYGHYTVDQAMAEVRMVLASLPPSSSSSDLVTSFLCTLYIPPCPAGELQQSGHDIIRENPRTLPLPCRPLCELAREEVLETGTRSRSAIWPSNIRCHVFPTDRCYTLAGPGEMKYVGRALVASGAGARLRDVIPQSVGPLESELGDDDPFEVQVVTLGTNQIPPRRYDLSELGDPGYFQGWADVQGTGAANDYCRVVGRGKRRFLSCAIAGSRGQAHQYVSKLGFDAGHPGTWFMRDVDSDGRDDYCRDGIED